MSPEKNRALIKILFKSAGILLTIASLVFIVFKFKSYEIEIVISPFNILILISSTILQILLSHAYAYIFYKLLCGISGQRFTLKPVFELYIRSIPQRYIPGNVMHYAGRQIMGLEYNIKQSVIALGSLFEIILYCTTTIILCLLLRGNEILFLLQRYVTFNNNMIAGIMILLFLFIFFGIIFRTRIFLWLRSIKHLFTKSFLVVLAQCSFIQSICFLSGGIMIFFMIRSYNSGITDVLLVLYGFVMASLIGTVTPGAPGGLGIREAVLLFVLGSACGESAVLQGALMQRFTIVVSDFIVLPVFKFLTGNIFSEKPGQCE